MELQPTLIHKSVTDNRMVDTGRCCSAKSSRKRSLSFWIPQGVGVKVLPGSGRSVFCSGPSSWLISGARRLPLLVCDAKLVRDLYDGPAGFSQSRGDIRVTVTFCPGPGTSPKQNHCPGSLGLLAIGDANRFQTPVRRFLQSQLHHSPKPGGFILGLQKRRARGWCCGRAS